MIESRFIMFFFIFIVICFIGIGAINLELKDRKYVSFLACLLSLMIIVGTCFFPFPYQDELLESMISGKEGLVNNFIPFRTILTMIKDTIMHDSYGIICYQFFGNIILFMPLGFSLCFYLEEKRKFLKMLGCVVLVTVLTETGQGVLNSLIQVNYRSVDVDDVMLNTFGGVLGFEFASFVVPVLRRIFGKKK